MFKILMITIAVMIANTAFATTCEQAIYKCKTESHSKLENIAKCEAAGAECKKSGEWIGPVTGKKFKMER